MIICYIRSVQAVAFAAISGIVGLSVLYCTVNGVTAALGASNLVLYTLIYTPMKRISIVNTWVGSVGKHAFYNINYYSLFGVFHTKLYCICFYVIV